MHCQGVQEEPEGRGGLEGFLGKQSWKKSGQHLAFFEVLGMVLEEFWGYFPVSYAILRIFPLFYIILLYFPIYYAILRYFA